MSPLPEAGEDMDAKGLWVRWGTVSGSSEKTAGHPGDSPLAGETHGQAILLEPEPGVGPQNDPET